MSELSVHALVSIELMKCNHYVTSPDVSVVSPHYSTSPDASAGGFTVLPDRVTLSGAGGSGSGGISLVGRETLLAGVVGACVSRVGVAISDVVLTRAGGVQRRLDSSLSCDVGTSALQLRRTVLRSVLTKYDRGSGVRLTT